MDRRDFMRSAAMGAAAGLSSLACNLPPRDLDPDAGGGSIVLPPPPGIGGDLGAASSLTPKRFNILLIAIDDLNDWVGCLGGHPNAHTPHMDRLAGQGVLFEQAHCASPLCCPSRTAILTGLSPCTTGVYGNFDNFRTDPRYGDWRTLPQHFQAHGYHSLMAGKIFHHTTGIFSDPQSWEEVLHLGGGTPYPRQQDRFLHGLQGKFPSPALNKHLDWFPLTASRETINDWRMADAVGGYLNREHLSPFFLTCGFSRPHLPWYAPKEFFDLYPLSSVQTPRVLDNDLDDLPRAARILVRDGKDFRRLHEAGLWQTAIQAYLACSSFTDACVGRVLTALEASPHRDNTVVVLFSDHGYHLGEKGHLGKSTLWEDATRVPLIIRAPGVTSAGGRCRSPVSLLDIYPTLAELCGLPPDRNLDGHNLGPLLLDPARSWPWPAITTLGKGSHAVRSSRYRLIRYVGGGEELYDHQRDPDEWHNRASDAQYASVRSALIPWLPTDGQAPAANLDGAL